MKKILITLFLILALVACSKKDEKIELKYSVVDIDNLAHETSHSNEKGEGALKLSDYAPGVNHLESKALMYKRLTFFAVSFDTVEQARSEALRLNQYYARNWLFDRVEGEPILEDYVIETFKGINPKRQIQRVPKKHEESSGEAHEAPHEAAHH
jgi:hypothetical protein